MQFCLIFQKHFAGKGAFFLCVFLFWNATANTWELGQKWGLAPSWLSPLLQDEMRISNSGNVPRAVPSFCARPPSAACKGLLIFFSLLWKIWRHQGWVLLAPGFPGSLGGSWWGWRRQLRTGQGTGSRWGPRTQLRVWHPRQGGNRTGITPGMG